MAFLPSFGPAEIDMDSVLAQVVIGSSLGEVEGLVIFGLVPETPDAIKLPTSCWYYQTLLVVESSIVSSYKTQV